MELFNLLKPEAVRVISAVSSKKRLLHTIGELAQSVHGLDASKTVAALQGRETLGPTGVGSGVALPHVRSLEIDKVVGTFIMLEKPVDFEAVDHQPVDLIFALFAPENAGVEHLKALALVSRTLRDAALRSKLRANPDSSTLFTILTEAQNVQAA
ncbi:MAG: PTS sugar transporter subunit IIA [Paracoccaceae bacterium]